ncbi:MAG: hypothetical protein IK095_05145 [Oscillospiraceae bacterium]|nr:hypothetical protein [Oscillospiraceae bacterium]
MLKACKYCGRIHGKDVDCGKRPVRTRYIRSESEAGRYSWDFAKRSKEIKERQAYLCPICVEAGDLRPKPIETHHIKKLRTHPELLLEDENLIALCEEHHRAADAGKIAEERLRDIAKKRDQNHPARW